jgi:hypothetical protein
MVGDSFCFGYENDYDETLQAMLDRRFGESANIVNFCVTGSSSIYYPYTVATFRQRFPHPLDALLVRLYTDMQNGDVPRVLAAHRNRHAAERVASERQERAGRIASALLDHGVAVYTKNGHYTRAAYEITARAVGPAIENLTPRLLSLDRDH